MTIIRLRAAGRPPRWRSTGLAVTGLSLAALVYSGSVGTAGKQRSFGIDYTVSVDGIPTLANTVEMWIPVPHNDPYQTISNLDVTTDIPAQVDNRAYNAERPAYQIVNGEYGNRMLHLRLTAPNLKPSLMLGMQFSVKRREHIRLGADSPMPVEDKSDKDPNMARWLESNRLVPLDEKIRDWAKEVVGVAGAKTDLEKARAIYNHIVATVKYDKSGQGWGRGDIYYACGARRGNCTDFHAIFIGYARALGIPARFSIGLPMPKDHGQGTILGYHCWAEFYIKGMGWIPVDASEAAKDPSRREYFFGAHDENRVEFSRGRDLILTPKQQGEPLNYFIYPYVEVDGKPYAGVKSTFRYGDLKR